MDKEQTRKVLDQLTIEDLQKEIKRKEDELKPKPLENIDFQRLINNCNDYINYIANGEIKRDDTNDRLYIYKCAMDCIFGKKVWEWIREKTHQ